MSQSVAERFVQALHSLEDTKDLETIAALFSDHCEVGNIVVPEKFHGRQGAREFWTKYRETFDSLSSSFRNSIESPGRAALEWTTEARTGTESIRYDGVSILEITGDSITRFRAYFDAGSLGRQISRQPD